MSWKHRVLVIGVILLGFGMHYCSTVRSSPFAEVGEPIPYGIRWQDEHSGIEAAWFAYRMDNKLVNQSIQAQLI